MSRRPFVLLAVLLLVAVCDRAPVAAHTIHPASTVVAHAPPDSPSPEATPTPTPLPPTDQPTPEPALDTSTAATAQPAAAACAGSATGTLTIAFENFTTGLTGVNFAVSAGCSVTVLLTSNYGLRASFRCVTGVPCTGLDDDRPPDAARNTGVTYFLTVTDATGQSRTVASVASKPFNLPTPIPLPTGSASPTPHAFSAAVRTRGRPAGPGA